MSNTKKNPVKGGEGNVEIKNKKAYERHLVVSSAIIPLIVGWDN